MSKRQKEFFHEPQEQSLPGLENIMIPEPISDKPTPTYKLEKKVALITGVVSGRLWLFCLQKKGLILPFFI